MRIDPAGAPVALTHAHILTNDGLIRNSALIVDEGGMIDEIDPEQLPAGCTIHDCDGMVLAPGIIDLHCDAIEKIYEPRPGAAFPMEVAMDQTDRVNAMAGITTAYHAISFGQDARANPQQLAQGIAWLQNRSLVEHRLHCRYEIACETSLDEITDLVERGQVGLLSIMDHTPGQGQFKDIEAFCAYYTKAHGLTHEQALAMAREKSENRSTGHGRALELTEVAQRYGVPVASHDDDSPERVAAVHATGISIAEFPITLETAQAAHVTGLATILGAPNILRGGSQSGSMRALDAVLASCCDCLCSDYAPWALMPAAWSLQEQAGLPLEQAWSFIAAGPARAAGLADRGVLARGLRADMVLIAPHNDRTKDQPRLIETWCHGRPVYQANYPSSGTSAAARLAHTAEAAL